MKEGGKRRRESADDLVVGQEKKVRAHVFACGAKNKGKST